MPDDDLTQEERELLAMAKEAEDAEQPPVEPEPEQPSPLEVNEAETQQPKRRGRPPKARVEEPAPKADEPPADADDDEPADSEDGTEVVANARGPLSPAQFADDGWGGLPVQMRGF